MAKNNETFFAFDFDGTVSSEELLPLIARELNLEEELGLLTSMTLSGQLPFATSFKLRFHILRSVPVEIVQKIASTVPLHPGIENFIKNNTDRCAIVTGNLDVWCKPFMERLGCPFYSSVSRGESGSLELANVLEKGSVIRGLAREHGKIVAIGDSHNDMGMFEEADISVAYGGVHPPVPQLIRSSDYVVYDGDALCRLLNTL